MTVDVELQYRQHLTAGDRELVGRVTGGADLLRALAHPDLEAAVFRPEPPTRGAGGGSQAALDRWDGPSPFLTFSVAVHRTAARLERASFVEERLAPRRRIPVFDVAPLRNLLADPLHRYFLVELLASYTKVSSGVAWTWTRRGWHRRRFSELDPVRLAGLLEVVDPTERAGIYRRLGDLALFLTGVFPDRGPDRLGAVGTARLLRLSGLPPDRGDGVAPVDLLEVLGIRWYRLAARAVTGAGLPLSASAAVTGTMGDRFGDARRVLNLVADDFLFPLRDRYFGAV